MSNLRNIAGYPGYLVSDEGRVFSKLARKGPVAKIEDTIQRELKPNRYEGRCTVNLRKNGKSYRIKVHKIVLETFVGPRPTELECCHWDGHCEHNTLRNLRWDTRTSNAVDKKRHGTHKKGELDGMAKLLNEDVAQIKIMLALKRSHRDISGIYEVSHATIDAIATGRTWKHIPEVAVI